jgi:predicted transcriptional regulator
MILIKYFIITGLLFNYSIQQISHNLPIDQKIQEVCLEEYEELSYDSCIALVYRLLESIIRHDKVNESIIHKRNSALANFRKLKLKHSREGKF